MQHIPSLRQKRQRRPSLRPSLPILMPSLESRVRAKAVQMYRYLHDEINALKEGGVEGWPFSKFIFVDDFHTVRRAAEELHLRPYDVHFSSSPTPPIYIFGAPLDDGDTDMTTLAVYKAFNRHGIFRDVLFNDENRMLSRFGNTSDAVPYPANAMRVESYLARVHHGSVIDPDSEQFAELSIKEKEGTLGKIVQFTHMLSGFERALVQYLKQTPIERCYAHVQQVVSHVLDRDLLVDDERELHNNLRTLVADNLDDPKNMIYIIHNLVSASMSNLDTHESEQYMLMLARLPGTLIKLRDRRFAFILQLQEAISPDMARFKEKIPKKEWVEHRKLVPNLAGLLRDADVNYAIFVPEPDAVWQYPDSVLNTL